jgi:hypothetical protein
VLAQPEERRLAAREESRGDETQDDQKSGDKDRPERLLARPGGSSGNGPNAGARELHPELRPERSR